VAQIKFAIAETEKGNDLSFATGKEARRKVGQAAIAASASEHLL
jgi:hypothetical protein